MSDERIGTAQRNQVLERLTQALAEGYLTLDDFEHRQVAVTSATITSHLLAQLHDLPAQFRWDPRAPAPSPELTGDRNVATFAQVALILGIVSIPLSVCLAGWVFGIAAVFFSIPGSRGANGWSRALIGRVLGIMGIVFSIGVLAIVLFAPKQG